MQVKRQQLELDMEKLTSSKLGKEYKAIYCHPAYLTSMQSASCEMPGWIKIVEKNINNFRYAEDITQQKVKRN